jgi:hypothetical protein
MAGSLSAYLERKLLDHFFKVASFGVPANLYVGLSTADPLDDASGNAEPGAGAYARVLCNTWDSAATSTGAARTANAAEIAFPEATASWGTVTHWTIWDASSGGNMLWHGTLDTSRAVGTGDVPTFGIGDLDLSISGKFSDAVHEDMLDHVMKVLAMSVPTNIYIGLSTADPAANGGSIAEPVGNGYARKACNTWNAASNSGGVGVTANTSAVDFDEASGSWGTITWFSLHSAASGGTYYGRGQLTSSRLVNTGDIPRFKAGEIDWTAE